uniref:Uncharacterized protein n=1 Tax=Vespula pensylvanica TaxID=30213 RepID=A0A834NZ20_VESPE|nr:hypothetical protein H0235_009299 [Vespula pensylvanica]
MQLPERTKRKVQGSPNALGKPKVLSPILASNVGCYFQEEEEKEEEEEEEEVEVEDVVEVEVEVEEERIGKENVWKRKAVSVLHHQLRVSSSNSSSSSVVVIIE